MPGWYCVLDNAAIANGNEYHNAAHTHILHEKSGDSH